MADEACPAERSGGEVRVRVLTSRPRVAPSATGIASSSENAPGAGDRQEAVPSQLYPPQRTKTTSFKKVR